MASYRWLRVLSCSAFLAGLGVLSIGCSSKISPGEYKIYRVAIDKAGSKSAGCYPDSKIPQSVKQSSDDARDSATWEIFAGSTDAEQYFLETGKDTLEGTFSDKSYAFETNKNDVSFEKPDETGYKYTKTDHVGVDITVDGKTITGTYTKTHSEKCSGTTCPAKMPAACSETLEFTGTEVDDVELKHDL